MKIKFALSIFIYVLLNTVTADAYDHLPDGYIGISCENKTQLKVSTKSCPVNDVDDDPMEIPDFVLSRMPGYKKPSNDSSFLKSVKGIVIENAILNKIDDSFFKLRYGDTLEAITIDETNFDYDHLIKNLIINKIKLAYLGISLQYLDSFPENIDKIEGLKKLNVDFMKKAIEIDDKLYNSESIETLVISRRKKINSGENISKLKKLKELKIYNSDSVYISNDLKNDKNLTTLMITSCNLIGNSLANINNIAQLEKLSLENCQLSDGDIDLAKLNNLKLLNLRCNNFLEFPEEILNLNKLKIFQFAGNYIKSVPIELMMKLPKRENGLQLEISELNFDTDFKNLFKSNEKLLQNQGYSFLISHRKYQTHIK